MHPAKETITGHAGPDKLVQTSLRGIAQKAKRNPKYRFRNLYHLLNINHLKQAWKRLNKKASAGVDKVSAKEFADNLEENLLGIVSQLREKRYKAKLVKRVYIPKSKDKTRPLGIPATADKVLQSAAATILEAIFEEDFSPQSYGYRPKTGAKKAVRDLDSELHHNKYNYVVEADIKGFFDNIDHEWLIKMVETRVNDRPFIRLIKKWLKAGILEPDGKIVHPVTGTPQGGVISPILANIYLHYVLDLWFEKLVKARCKGEAYICRYADDFVAAFRYREDADRFYQVLLWRLQKFGLQLSPEKTRIISFSRFRKAENTSFDFLGFEFRWEVSRQGKNIIRKRTSRCKMRKSLAEFKNWCKEARNNRLCNIFHSLNAKLRGYYAYYGIAGNYQSLYQYYCEVCRMLYKWLNRRSQRHSFSWSQFVQVLDRFKIEQPRINKARCYQLELDFSLV